MRTLTNLIDEDALDINSTYPSIIVRKGMGMLFILFVLFLGVLSFIPYTENSAIKGVVVQGSVRAVPIETNAVIDTLYQKPGAYVKRGDALARVLYTSRHVVTVVRASVDGKLLASTDAGNGFYIQENTTATNKITVQLDHGITDKQLLGRQVSVLYSGSEDRANGKIVDYKDNAIRSLVVIELSRTQAQSSGKVMAGTVNPNVSLNIREQDVSVLSKTLGVLASKFNVKPQ